MFKVFGKTRPGIERRSPGPLANPTHLTNEPVSTQDPLLCVCVCVWFMLANITAYEIEY